MLLFSLSLSSGCQREPEAHVLFRTAFKPLVLFELKNSEPPSFPEGLAWCWFASGNTRQGLTLEPLLASADSVGMLLAVLEQEPFRSPFGLRQHVFLGLDHELRPVAAHPEDLMPGLLQTPFTWSVSGQEALLDFFRKFRPDILTLSVRLPGGTDPDEVLAFWRERASREDFRFIAFRSPESGSRGWCALTWRGLEGRYLPGLTAGGFQKTLNILAGLPWDPSTTTGIPCAAILLEAESP